MFALCSYPRVLPSLFSTKEKPFNECIFLDEKENYKKDYIVELEN